MFALLYGALRYIFHESFYCFSSISVALLNRRTGNAAIEIEQSCCYRSGGANCERLQISIGVSADFEHDLLRTKAIFLRISFTDLIHVVEQAELGKHIARHEDVEGAHADVEERFNFGNDFFLRVDADEKHHIRPEANRRRDRLLCNQSAV